MLGSICAVLLTLLGAGLIVAGGYLGFDFLPRMVDEQIVENVILEDDTIQLERFLVTPVALHFKIHVFNITNPQQVMQQGQPARLQEVGPYVYWQHKRKEVIEMDDNSITYREHTDFEFDAEASYPLTQEDLITVVNVPYNAILQTAEITNPGLMPVLNPLLGQVFGAANNQPIFTAVARDLFFDGIRMCVNPNFLGQVACNPIREQAADSDNMRMHEDGSFSFSFFHHKDNEPTKVFTVDRGLLDHYDLGKILFYDEQPNLSYWNAAEDSEQISSCNMLNGTDSSIYRPFVNISEPLQAFNPDICRSVELYYQQDTEYEDIPAIRFVSGPGLLSGEDACWCLGETAGVTQQSGCLFPGVMELFSCTGAHMVFSAPHFLYADFRYLQGVLGLDPVADEHQIFLDLEPNSGTILRGVKRAQFNLFLRPISSITGTNNLSPTLTPIIWVEDGMNLPEEFVDEVKSTLLRPVRLINILRIVAIVLGAVLMLLGIFLVVRLCSNKNEDSSTPTPTPISPGKGSKDLEQARTDFSNVQSPTLSN